MPDVLTATRLTKAFGRGHKRVEALRGINVDLTPNRVTGLVGPNGAGKSTFLKLALGFLLPSGGELALFGMPPGDLRALARVGYLPEHPAYPPNLTGREFLRYVAGLRRIPKATRATQIDALLAEVGILHAADRRIGTYSKGMTQRLGLAQAMLGQPEFLILDEPMSGLDPVGRAEVKAFLRRRREEGLTILFCSHILDDVERLCDNVLMLFDGRIRFDGPVREVIDVQARGWTVVVRAPTAPDLADVDWARVGEAMWTAADLDEPARVEILRRAAAREVELLRLDPSARDLESAFIATLEGTGGAGDA